MTVGATSKDLGFQKKFQIKTQKKTSSKFAKTQITLYHTGYCRLSHSSSRKRHDQHKETFNCEICSKKSFEAMLQQKNINIKSKFL